MCDQDRDGRLSELETAKRVLAPVSRKTLLTYLQKRRPVIAAGVLDRHREWRQRLRLCDKASNIFRTRRIADNKGNLGASFLEFGSSGLELLPVATGDHYGMAAPGESPRDCRT